MDEFENGLDMSPTMESAVTLHEWYGCLVNAGFTEEQALTLVSDLMCSANSDGCEEEE